MTTLLEQVQAQEVRYSKIVGWTLANRFDPFEGRLSHEGS